MLDTIKQTKEALEATRAKMATYANKKRIAPPEYHVGDMVMLNGQHIKTKRPCRKLDHKFHGPFEIERVISPTAVRLTLPVKWKKHPTFHVSEVEPYEAGNRPIDPADALREAEDIEADDEFVMEMVKGSVKRRNRILYQVKWEGYPSKKDWTFEPLENFSVDGLELVRKFHISNPDSPRDYRLDQN
jgi:hypothetical protein